MIQLVHVPPVDLHRLAGLRQHPGQYANDGAEMILDPTAMLTFHAIEVDGEVVGMFKLDPLYHERHDFAEPGAIGLRGMLIDRARQGQGIGSRALSLLASHVRNHYPDAREVVLTVNELNPVGRAAYLKAGFRDGGEVYTGGSRGPQHVLRMDLKVPVDWPPTSPG